MLKSKVGERVQEVILPDFPDDDNTVTTVTKSRRVSFGTNFVKEFIVGSTVSGQCLPEYEQAFPSSDSSTADSSLSGAESGILGRSGTFATPHEALKVHKPVPPVGQSTDSEFGESRPKVSRFSSTVCFSADSPTADVEFTEGCLSLAKSILEKKNKEMTVFIQAKSKDDEKGKEDETKYFDGSQLEMSMTRRFKPKSNKREEKFESEKTKIFGKFEDEMSVTRCSRIFNSEEEGDADWEDAKENRMPLDMMIRLLDKDSSDMENELFNPEKTLVNFLNVGPFDLSNESEKLNLNESVDISVSFQSNMFKGSSQPSPANQTRKSTTSFHEFLTPNGGKSLSGPPAPDDTISEMSLNETEDVFIPEREIEPPLDDDKMNRSTTSQMDLDGVVESLGTERESSPVEATVTDQKINKSKSLEMDGVETEPSLADISNCDKLNKSEDVLSAEATAADKSPERMSLDESGDGLPSEQTQSLVEPQETDDRVNKSEQMSFDGSKCGLSAEQALSLVEPQDKEISRSDRMSLNGSNGGLLSEQAQSLAEEPQEVDDNMNKSKRMSLDGTDDEEQSVEHTASVENKTSKSPNRMSLDEAEEVLASQKECDVVEPAQSLDEVGEPEREPAAVDRPSTDNEVNESVGKSVSEADEESTNESEPSLLDLKVVESLKEQSKEPDCVWSLKDFRHPRDKAQGLLSFECRLLESWTTILLGLKVSNEDSLDACSIVTDRELSRNEESRLRLPEYRPVVDFGFGELKKYFDERRTKVGTIRHVPYFMDQINSFMLKTNAYLRQIYSILTSYPGSRMEGSALSFRFYSFPIFFSCTVSIDLSNLYRLTKSSLSFEHDFGSLDENKIREIFQNCLKYDNSLCEFVVQSTKYLIELEKESGYVSKRQHIRLLPAELKL